MFMLAQKIIQNLSQYSAAVSNKGFEHCYIVVSVHLFVGLLENPRVIKLFTSQNNEGIVLELQTSLRCLVPAQTSSCNWRKRNLSFGLSHVAGVVTWVCNVDGGVSDRGKSKCSQCHMAHPGTEPMCLRWEFDVRNSRLTRPIVL